MDRTNWRLITAGTAVAGLTMAGLAGLASGDDAAAPIELTSGTERAIVSEQALQVRPLGNTLLSDATASPDSGAASTSAASQNASQTASPSAEAEVQSAEPVQAVGAVSVSAQSSSPDVPSPDVPSPDVVSASPTWRALLAVVLALTIMSVRLVLLVRLDERIDRDLQQEAGELRTLSRGSDPATGEPFGDDIERILRVFMERNVPARNETFVTYVDGRAHLRSLNAPPVRLDQNPGLTAQWGRVTDSVREDVTRTRRGRGRLHHEAVEVRGAARPCAREPS